MNPIPQKNANLNWICSWLDAEGLASDEVYRLANKFQFGLFALMENDIGLGARVQLIETVREALQRLVCSDPGKKELQRDLAVCNNDIGSVLKAQGKLPEALKAYRTSLALMDLWRPPSPETWIGSMSCRCATAISAMFCFCRAISRAQWKHIGRK